jgi:hypothetical protein
MFTQAILKMLLFGHATAAFAIPFVACLNGRGGTTIEPSSSASAGAS